MCVCVCPSSGSPPPTFLSWKNPHNSTPVFNTIIQTIHLEYNLTPQNSITRLQCVDLDLICSMCNSNGFLLNKFTAILYVCSEIQVLVQNRKNDQKHSFLAHAGIVDGISAMFQGRICELRSQIEFQHEMSLCLTSLVILSWLVLTVHAEMTFFFLLLHPFSLISFFFLSPDPSEYHQTSKLH